VGIHLTGEEFLQHMDAAGVAKAALVQASTFHGYDNSYVADAVAAHPDRFAGVCCIDPLADDAPAVLRHWIIDRGLHGVRLFLSGSTIQTQTVSLDGPDLKPFWEAASELEIPVDVQTSQYDTVANVAREYPKVIVIVDHLGGVKTEDGPPYAIAQPLFDLAVYPNVIMKYSNNNLTRSNSEKSTTEAFFSTLISKFGRERLIWGSNFPNTRSDSDTPYVDAVNVATSALSFLSEEDRDWVMGKAAVQIYPSLA
jgi:predicted TIM-barrel fold metal-dependent hydrolase